jgi:hypothetical protein
VVKLRSVSHSDILKDNGALAEIVKIITETNANYIYNIAGAIKYTIHYSLCRELISCLISYNSLNNRF